jgi:nucleoside-diphosphate-sugar epimerase
LAARLSAQGQGATGMVRSAASARELEACRILPLIADLDHPDTLPDLPTPGAQIFYLAPPPEHGLDDPRLAVFLSRCEQKKPAHIVYVSTSGIYGDCQGAWVDETTPARPQTDRATRRHAAECLLRDWSTNHGTDVVILRVGGIYGPQRLPIDRLRRGLTVICPEDAPYSNRIHVDDLAGALIAAAQRGRAGEAYNAADGNPTTMTDYFFQVADFAGLPRPSCVPLLQAEGHVSEAMLSYIRESRRLRIDKLKAELGLTFLYPKLSDGLHAFFKKTK